MNLLDMWQQVWKVKAPSKVLVGYRLLPNMMREASAGEWVSKWKSDWYHSGAMRRAQQVCVDSFGALFCVPPQAKYVSRRVVMRCADLWDIEEQCQCQAHPLCWVFPFQCNGVKINLSHDFISTRWWRDQLEASWCQTPSASPPVLNLKNQVCSTNLSRSVQQREQRRHCNTSLPSILVAGSLWSFLSNKYLKKRWVLDKCLWCSLKN